LYALVVNSQARIPAAWARRNARQVSDARSRHTVEVASGNLLCFVISVGPGGISVAYRMVGRGSPWKLGVSSRLEAISAPARIQNEKPTLPR